MKRNITSVISAIVYSLFLIASCRAEGMQFPNSKLTSQKINLLLAAKQLRVLRRKVVTTTTTEVSEEYELPHEDRSRLSDKLDPESKKFLDKIEAEEDRYIELTIINDALLFFGLSEAFDPEDTESLNKFMTEHFIVKINGKEIPHNAIERVKIKKGDKPTFTFSLEIKNNKLSSLGTIFKNTVASVTDKIKEMCLLLFNPLSFEFTYKCPVKTADKQQQIGVAPYIYGHPRMAQLLAGRPQLTKMLEDFRWPEWRKVVFKFPDFPESQETT